MPLFWKRGRTNNNKRKDFSREIEKISVSTGGGDGDIGTSDDDVIDDQRMIQTFQERHQNQTELEPALSDDVAHAYESVDTFRNDNESAVASTSTVPARPAQLQVAISSINNEEPGNLIEPIYAVPDKNKKGKKPLKVVVVDNDDGEEEEEDDDDDDDDEEEEEGSEENFAVSDLEDFEEPEDFSRMTSSDERRKNVDSLKTLNLIVKDKDDENEKIFRLKTDFERLKKKENEKKKNEKLEERRTTMKIASVDKATSTETVTETKNKDEDETSVIRDVISRLVEVLNTHQPEFSVEKTLKNNLIGNLISKSENIDMRYFLTLFITYDNRLKEKDRLIQSYEETISDLECKLEAEKDRRKRFPLNLDDWKILCEESQLVSKRNDELTLKQAKVEAAFKEQMEKHSKKIDDLKEENEKLKSSIRRLEEKNTDLQEKSEKYVSVLKRSVTREKHKKNIDELKKILAETKEKHSDELTEAYGNLERVQSDLKKATLLVSDLRAANCQLEGQNIALKKLMRLVQQKSIKTQEELKIVSEEFAINQEYMQSVRLLINQLAAERDAYLEMVQEERIKNYHFMRRVVRGSLTRKKLEEKLKNCKSTKKKEDSTDKNKESQTSAQHDQEISRLQALLKRRQEKLQTILNEKTKLEQDMELIWRVNMTSECPNVK